MREIPSYFPDTYAESRARFRSRAEGVRARWPRASLYQRAHPSAADLTTDWISAPASGQALGLVVVSTALHGIEGYVGSAMLEVFLDEFLPRISAEDNSLLLIHAINPWGMANRRRVNAENIDLNRNFVADEEMLDPDFNPEYDSFRTFLNPKVPVGHPILESMTFATGLAGTLIRYGAGPLRSATLLGQYRHPRGIYFGGRRLQEETELMRELLHMRAAEAQRILILDMHTGYGPAHQMAIVNSCHDTRPSTVCQRRFGYPLVVATNAEEFYSMRGDMIDYFTREFKSRYPRKSFYGAAFEFGTLGETLPAILRSLRAMILENKLHQNGSSRPAHKSRVEAEFEALFNPHDLEWRRKALADGRRAFEGILRSEGFIS
jgi:hypothetical protein